MNNNKRVLIGVIGGVLVVVAAVLAVALSGGKSKTPRSTATPPPTLTPVPTATPSPTVTPPPTPTFTPPPSQTPLPTATSLPTPMPTLAPGSPNKAWTPSLHQFDGVPMVYVPAGCFMMGYANGADDEKPVHEVCLDAFWIDQTEVTNAQFATFKGQAGQPSHWTGNSQPRETINRFEAEALCQVRGGTLPTEAQWEYAARGPEGWVYPWGNDFVPDNAVFSGNAGGQTADVGSRPGGASWVGALDMSGNVWEWVSDWYGAYPADRQVNPTGPAAGDNGVLRGAAYDYSNTNDLRATIRYRYIPGSGSQYVGFRCVRGVTGGG